MHFPIYQQLDMMDCGPTSLRMTAKFYGRSYTLQNLREKSFVTRHGVSMLGISEAAESIEMHTNGVEIADSVGEKYTMTKGQYYHGRYFLSRTVYHAGTENYCRKKFTLKNKQTKI